MKKLIIIIFFVMPFFGMAQNIKFDYRLDQSRSPLDTFNISTVDTSWVFNTSATYSMGVQIYWSALTGTLDGLFKLQATIDGVNWNDLNMASYTPAAASGSVIFHVPRYIGTDYAKVRIFFDRNSITGGKVIPSVLFNRTK